MWPIVLLQRLAMVFGAEVLIERLRFLSASMKMLASPNLSVARKTLVQVLVFGRLSTCSAALIACGRRGK